jgi:hypothetical protein
VPVIVSHFHPNLVFAEHAAGALHSCLLLALASNIRLGWSWSAVTTNLSYCTMIKGVIDSATVSHMQLLFETNKRKVLERIYVLRGSSALTAFLCLLCVCVCLYSQNIWGNAFIRPVPMLLNFLLARQLVK